MLVVLISGASGSGKTVLSHRLLTKLKHEGLSAQILNMDDYYRERPEEMDGAEYRKKTNFDTPDMLHLDLLQADLSTLNEGASITKPLFDFKTNRRKGTEEIAPSDIVILEGIFAQYFYKNLWPAGLKAVTVNIATDSYFDIVERRIKRDTEHRGRVRSESIAQERKYVGPGFLKYTASSSMSADIYVRNDSKKGDADQILVLDTAAEEIIVELKKLRKEGTPKRAIPDVRDMVAKSHFLAGSLDNPLRFVGHFSGVFGSFKGDFVREFSEKELKLKNLMKPI